MSAVIYAAIVVIWLIVLVPMWLRRHDAAADERSSERFEGAMRVLARRPATAGVDRRYAVRPRRSAATAVHVSAAEQRVRRSAFGPDRRLVTADLTVEEPVSPVPAARRSRSSSPSVVARRRRTLLILAALSIVAVGMTALGVAPWPVQLVPELLLVGFVVHLRVQARQTAVVSRQRRRGSAAPTVPPARSARPTVGRRVAPEPVPAPVDRLWAEVDSPSSATVSPYDDVDDVDDGRESVAATGGSGTWEPTPVPPPTYTMKPAAPAVPGDGLADDHDGVDESELEVILERDYEVSYEPPRAVND